MCDSIYKDCTFFENEFDKRIIKNIEDGKNELANHIKKEMGYQKGTFVITVNKFTCTTHEFNVILKILKSRNHCFTYEAGKLEITQ
jgi:hypothetical protein